MFSLSDTAIPDHEDRTTNSAIQQQHRHGQSAHQHARMQTHSADTAVAARAPPPEFNQPRPRARTVHSVVIASVASGTVDAHAPSVSARGGGGGGEVRVATSRASHVSPRVVRLFSTMTMRTGTSFFEGFEHGPEQYCAIGVGYSLDLETFNFTPVLHITKRGQAVDVSEDKNTNTNSNT